MTDETLRALSRTYAAGDLDRESYRLQRRRLLDDVVAGITPVHAFEPPEPETPTVFPYDDDDGDTTQEILPQFDTSTAGGGVRRIALALLAVLVIAGIAWTALTRHHDDAGTPDPALATPPTAAPADLIDAFLAAGVWNSASMDALGESWDDLTQSEQDGLKNAASMRRLNDGLLQQINAENALIALGDSAGAVEKQGRLLDLAERLGLDNDRLRRANEQWLARQTGMPATNDATATFDVEATAAASSADGDEQQQRAVTGVDKNPLPDVPSTPALPQAPVAPANETATDTPTPTPSPPAAIPPATRTSTTTLRSNCKAELARGRRPYCIDVLDGGTKGPVLVVLPPGEFTMGGHLATEQPRHAVSINYSFAIGLFEVSVNELAAFCAATATSCPAQPWDDTSYPAVNVSWTLAQAYTQWLSKITGVGYRLPSEAEWEYAARGGTTTVYPFGDELLPTHARFSYAAVLDQPLPANDRSLNRNEFRLYHMVGNVREWVLDGWHENHGDSPADGTAAPASEIRVVRGGSYRDAADELRSAARHAMAQSAADAYTGFRVVRPILN